MTLEETKIIMGDFEELRNKSKSHLWFNNNSDSIKDYFLIYPSSFGSSTNPEIQFDPITQVVTNVYCGK